MTITIECECGNRITMNVSSKKYLQLRDNLKIHDFHFDGAEYDKNNNVSEFRICCNKCKNYILLGVD